MEYDLISRSALIEELHHVYEGDGAMQQAYEYMGIDECIRSMPSVPVKTNDLGE